MPVMERFHEAFDACLQRDAARPFLYMQDGRDVSLRQLGQMADALAAELCASGVREGDRVLIVAENCPEHVALLLACSRVGAWSCGVNARMAPGEVAAFADKADARCIYFTAAVSSAAQRHAQSYRPLNSALPGLLRSPAREPRAAVPGELARRVAAVIFTSGTSGMPKGVMVTHDGLLHFGRVSAQSRQLGFRDRSYAYLPMTHIFGLGTVLAASLHAGAALVMRSQFDPGDILDALARHAVSQLQGPPTLFARLLAHIDDAGAGRPAVPHLRYLYTGAGPLDAGLKRRVEACFGMPMHHGYGLSEYAGSLHVTALGQHRGDTSAGLPVEGAEVRVTGDAGQELPAGERGELWLRGRGLMAGYFRDAEATAQAMRPGGWYASGDIGCKDAQGALFVVGRLKEMIIRSGFNVYPAEVETVLRDFPDVREAAVLGLPEDGGNEQVIAFVALRPDRTLDRAALDAHLRACLSPYKRPAQVHVVSSFPMTQSGKILKRELLAGLAEG